MPREHEDLKSVWDMVDAARGVTDLVRTKTLAQYSSDRALQWAVERGIEIIGEAARRVSDEFRASHPEVAWAAIIATRHIIAHDYDDVQHDKVWRVATHHAHVLIQQLEPILRERPPSP